MLVGLIGAGIQRSLTPAMHEEEARRQGLRLHYQLIDLDRAPASASTRCRRCWRRRASWASPG